MAVKYPIPINEESNFPIENIPFGVFSTASDPEPRIATIIGDYVVDIKALANHNVFSNESLVNDLSRSTLNAFAGLSKKIRSEVRNTIIDLLSNADSLLFKDENLNKQVFVPVQDAKMHLPMQIGGFTDFLTSETHSLNCADIASIKMHQSFYHFPTAYNGRASSVVVSGTPVVRPNGMVPTPQDAQPFGFGPCARLDFELEMGIFVSNPIRYAHSVTANQAHIDPSTTSNDHIFGFVLLNDWSARDIQFAEMQPLGPFNGKGTATTISPWIIVPEALEHVRTGPSSSGARAAHNDIAKHLQHSNLDQSTWSIDLEVSILSSSSPSESVICRTNMIHNYWSPAQMLSHHSTSGCGLLTGDLIGTGTISGPGHTAEKPTLACLFELAKGGRQPIKLTATNEERSWLQDGDEVVFRGWATNKDGRKGRIGFGECRGKVMPRREVGE